MARRKRRAFNIFSLSFLDIMACGFGAVVLFLMIVNHDARQRSEVVNEDLRSEVELLQEEVLLEEQDLVQIRSQVEKSEKDLLEALEARQRLALSLDEKREALSDAEAERISRRERIDALKASLKESETESKRLQESREPREGTSIREFTGEGDRQYVTGVRTGGKRTLVLVDGSASMLDETIVNIIRRRNMSEAEQRNSPKWRRAVATVEWIMSQIDPEGQYQLYTFDSTATPLLDGSDGQWLEASNGTQVGRVFDELNQHIPAGGTSLVNAFTAIESFESKPDNLFLIIDSLPTQGESKPRGSAVSPQRRLRYFSEAADALPSGIPVNVILFPMEGDPRASSAYWQLAQWTAGSFLTPSRDWP